MAHLPIAVEAMKGAPVRCHMPNVSKTAFVGSRSHIIYFSASILLGYLYKIAGDLC
jgi:hypothetical protein